MGTTSKHSWSRRDFLKGAAAGTMSVAALGALGGCSPQQSASTASAAAADSGEAGTYDVMQELSTFNRGQNASAKAPTTACCPRAAAASSWASSRPTSC